MEDRSTEGSGKFPELIDSVRAEVAARRMGLHEALGERIAIPDIEHQPVDVAAPARRDELPFADRHDLSAILDYDGEEFVWNAYRAVLKRDPDPHGGAQVLYALYQGSRKVDLLAALKDSEEGQRAGVHIAGLARVRRLQRWSAWPVLGPVFRILGALVDLPDALARLERAGTRRARHDAVQAASLIDVAAQTNRNSAAAAGLASLVRQLDEKALPLKVGVSLLGNLSTTRSEVRDLRQASAQAAVGLIALQAGLQGAAQRAGQLEAELAAVRESTVANAVRLSDIDKAALPPGLDAAAMDAFYLAFEDRERGTRASILERVSVYVPIVKEAGAGSAARPVLDVGCGRGELLEVLKQAGLAARGIDISTEMVDTCVQLGLDAQRADVLAHLRELPDDSLGAVTGLHIVEHLGFPVRLAVIDQVLRVLAPGGVMAFETPNPENLRVGACTFWIDPTHEQPLPPSSMKAIVELRGFVNARILPLHPSIEHLPTVKGELRDTLNHMIYGPQDYSIIAYKPA